MRTNTSDPWEIKRLDAWPIPIEIYDNGEPVDLTSATEIHLRVESIATGHAVVDRDLELVDIVAPATNGTILWRPNNATADETEACGDYRAEVKVVIDGLPKRFPNVGYVLLRIVSELHDTPAITSVTPATGVAAGGTSVVILGEHFVDGPPDSTVTFGGAAATSIVLTGSTRIDCKTPVGLAGYVSVVVTNPDGNSGTKMRAFRYT